MVRHTQCANRISTHTLTWSVTCYLHVTNPRYAISTHTLTWSVTYKQRFCAKMILYFNSHAHVERDLYVCRNGNRKSCISTHTLTWSVTGFFCTLAKNSVNFNSHAHVERDKHCHGVVAKVANFNSHAHVERDIYNWAVVYGSKSFQLTRSRGA